MKRMLACLALLAIEVSCLVGPNYKRPAVPIPAQHRGQAADASSLADLPFWQLFGDKQLESHLREALRANHDLRTAVARVDELRAKLGVARADYYPSVSLSGQGGYTRNPAPSPTPDTIPLGLAANISWEVDFWGRVRRSTEAARASLLASEEGQRAAVASLTSSVAQAYFELTALDYERHIVRRALAARQETLELFQMRMQGGVATELEVARAEASLAEARAAVYDVERRTVLKEHELGFLLGRNPGQVARAMTLYERGVPARVPAGLPATLLERRPDLRQAEATLRSAGAAIGVAKAAFFPTIKLTGDLGVQSDALNGPSGIGMILGSLAAGLTAPVFQGGALTSKYKIALAQYEQSKIAYEKAVLTAFREVADALVTLDKLRRYRAEQEKQVAMLRTSVDLSKRRYRGGLSNYLEVLDAEQSLYSVEVTLAKTRLSELTAFVQLYKALGGGFDDPSRR
jgi:outer membrane protein, multidrug efflux system